MSVYLKPEMCLEKRITGWLERDFLPPCLHLLYAYSTKHSFEFLKGEKRINDYNLALNVFCLKLSKRKEREDNRELRKGGHNYTLILRILLGVSTGKSQKLGTPECLSETRRGSVPPWRPGRCGR